MVKNQEKINKTWLWNSENQRKLSPSVASRRRKRAFISEDLPAPVRPTTPAITQRKVYQAPACIYDIWLWSIKLTDLLASANGGLFIIKSSFCQHKSSFWIGESSFECKKRPGKPRKSSILIENPSLLLYRFHHSLLQSSSIECKTVYLKAFEHELRRVAIVAWNTLDNIASGFSSTCQRLIDHE